MRVLLTGGAGFIGSHVLAALRARGASCWVLDNLETGSRANVPEDVPLLVGDVRDPQAVREAYAAARPEAVVHLAAMVSVALSMDDPLRCWEANVTGTRLVLEEGARAGLARFVYASSAAVYGDEPTLPKTETAPLRPLSPYAESKLQNERDAAYFGRYLAIDTVGLRFFNVYGPRQRPDSPYSGVISILCDALLAGKPFRRFGDGEESRDFIYVEDVAAAVAAAALASAPGPASVFNVGRGERASLNDLIAAAERATGQRLLLVPEPARAGDVKHSCSDPGALKRHYGLRAGMDLEAGLARTLAWLEGPRPEALSG